MAPFRPIRKRRSAARQRSGTAAVRDKLPVPVLRKTGLPAIGHLPWGTHACVFYATKADLLETAVAYFKAGLQSNEFCLWLISGPVTERDARDALRRAVPQFDRYEAAGQIELLDGLAWLFGGERVDLRRMVGSWSNKLREALPRGFEGMRAIGNAFWIGTRHWNAFLAYERALDRLVAGQRIIVLCTYSLRSSTATDVFNVARVHQCSVGRQRRKWELLVSPELIRSKLEIRKLKSALDVLSKPFPGSQSLTPRERVALAHIVRGATSKEAARTLGVSPRTVEFHRANIIRKLGARNTVDVMRRVLA